MVIKEIAIENDIPFKEIQKRSIMFVEELKLSSEHLGYNIEEDSIDYIVKEYLRKKKNMSDYDKSRYLKILLYLSEIYEVNLRELLTTPEIEKKEISTIDINELLRNLSNPLDNEELIKALGNLKNFVPVGTPWWGFDVKAKPIGVQLYQGQVLAFLH